MALRVACSAVILYLSVKSLIVYKTKVIKVMKSFTAFLFILVGLALVGAPLQAAPRTWKNNDGKEIKADLLRVDGDNVRLKLTRNRQVFIIPISSLSEADQKYIEEQKAILAEGDQAAQLASRKAKWTEDWDEAKKEAKETGLPILLFMTGSDWCGYCMRLKAGVFEKSDFQRFANKNLILMTADFPRGSQSKSTKKQNAELKGKYPFGGYPTVFLLDKRGKEIGKFSGYGGDSPKEYIAKLEAKLK
jgi:thioredoxin-related protein